MKKFYTFLLCFMLIFSLSSCNEPQKPKEFTVLTWADYIPHQTISEFTEDTGIKVNYVTAQTNEEILSMVEEDPENYDLIIASDYAMNILREKNLLQEINYQNFENAKYIAEGYTKKYYDPEGKFTVPYSTAGILIGYDATKTDIIIDSLADLLAPDLKNEIVFIDDASAVVGIANMILGKAPEDCSDIDNTAKILQTLSQNAYRTSKEITYPEDALATGEAPVAVLFTSQLGYATAVNDNVEIVYPKEGFLCSIDAMAIPANSDGAEFATAFMNYVHDPVVNGKIMPEIGCSTTNISGLQFMEDDYRESEGYNIRTAHADEGVLFPKLEKEKQDIVDYLYQSQFK